MEKPGGCAAKAVSFDAACRQLRDVIDHLDKFFEGDDRDCERVLMDVDLDGRRYLLVRTPSISRNGHGLSPREIEIVRLVAEGHPNKVIAAVLDISTWTVCTHVRRIFVKLGVTSRAAMVARAAEFASSGGRPAFADLCPPRRERQSSEQAPSRNRQSRIFHQEDVHKPIRDRFLDETETITARKAG